MVMSVDEEKGYINLSKKRVEPEDAEPKKEQFAKAKAVHGIMQHVAATHGLEIEALCEKVSWPLHEKYPSAFEAFKKHLEGEINVWEDIDFGDELAPLADKIKEDVMTHMKRRLAASTLRLMAKCEVGCHEYEGIDAIKESLHEGFKASKDDISINIKLIAHPVFAFTCICNDKEQGVNVLKDSMNLVKEAITKRGGHFKIISEPTIQKKDDGKGAEDSDSDGSGSEKSYHSESDPEGQEVDMGDLNEEDLKRLEAMKDDDDE